MRVLTITDEARFTESLRLVFEPAGYLLQVAPSRLHTVEQTLPLYDLCFYCCARFDGANQAWLEDWFARPNRPRTFILTELCDSRWEEEAIRKGVEWIFFLPLRLELMAALIQRGIRRDVPLEIPAPVPAGRPQQHDGLPALKYLRNFSRPFIAGGPLFLEDYLQQLREALSASRLLLFLPEPNSGGPATKLHCACALGMGTQPFAGVRLSTEQGIAGWLRSKGRLVERKAIYADPHDLAALQDMVIFGAEVALPLCAPPDFFGVLLVGAQITGSAYSPDELAGLYHLAEDMAATFLNASLEKRARRDRLISAAILQSLEAGFAVIRDDLEIVDNNNVLPRYLSLPLTAKLRFEDLPEPCAKAIYEVLKGGKPSVIGELVSSAGTLQLQVQVRPLEFPDGGGSAHHVLLIVTPRPAPKEPGPSDALLGSFGIRLVDEFRNAWAPLATIVQMAASSSNPGGKTAGDLLQSSATELGLAMGRIRRRLDGLDLLGKPSREFNPVVLDHMINAARTRIAGWIEARQAAGICWPIQAPEAKIFGDESALALSLAELVSNAIATGPTTVSVNVTETEVNILVENPGLAGLPEPPFGQYLGRPTRSASLGMGLAVVERVVMAHHGRLHTQVANGKTVIRVTLPLLNEDTT